MPSVTRAPTGQDLVCLVCHKQAQDIDHVVNRGMGGSKERDVPENKVPLCRECHELKTLGRIGTKVYWNNLTVDDGEWRYAWHREPDGPWQVVPVEVSQRYGCLMLKEESDESDETLSSLPQVRGLDADSPEQEGDLEETVPLRKGGVQATLTHDQRVVIAQTDWMGRFSETGWEPPKRALSDEQIVAVIAEFRREVKHRQWRHGDFGNWLVKTRGEEAYQFLDGFGYDPAAFTRIMAVCEHFTGLRIRKPTLSYGHHEVVYTLDPESQEAWLDKAEDEKLNSVELRQAIGKANTPPLVDPAVATYRTVVIDPPWPMQKIEREVRPKQGQSLDYAVKSVDEIADWKAQNLMAEDGCHVYLWTTQRFLEDAMRIMDGWGVKRECLLVWNKNVGITPYSWMYNAEFVLFGRVGNLPLLKNGEKVVFDGKVREHSRKPDEFYDLVRLVSPEPRIDVFSREPRDGFAQWGDEKERFGG